MWSEFIPFFVDIDCVGVHQEHLFCVILLSDPRNASLFG